MILAWLILIPLIGGLLAAWHGRLAHAFHGHLARVLPLLFMLLELALAVCLWAGWIENPGRLDLPWIPSIGARFLLSLDGLSLLMVALTALLGVMAVLIRRDAGILPACPEGVPPSVLGGRGESQKQRANSEDEGRMPSTHQDAGETPARHAGRMPATHIDGRSDGRFHFLMLWMLAGIVGVFLAMDLLLFYFFWEMMVIPLCFLIGIYGGPGRAGAAMKVFVFTQLSGLFLLASSIVLAATHAKAAGGVWTFSYFELLGTSLSPAAATWLMLGFFAAFAVKLPALGVHTWLVDAHVEAPVSGAVDVSGLVVKVGAYGMLRFVVPLFGEAVEGGFATFAQIVGVAGILYGALMAFAQTDLKRLVAYSTISHMGFALVGVFSFTDGRWNELALAGVTLLILTSGIGSGALFVVIGIVHSRTNRRELKYLGGLWQAMPRLGGVGMFFALAAMGLPALGSFVAEVLVLAGAFQSSPAIAAVAAGGLVLSVVYALWLVQRVFQGELPMEQTDVIERDLGAREWLTLAPAIAVMLWLGVYPKTAIDTATPAIREMRGIAHTGMRSTPVRAVSSEPSMVSEDKDQGQDAPETHGRDARATGGAP